MARKKMNEGGTLLCNGREVVELIDDDGDVVTVRCFGGAYKYLTARQLRGYEPFYPTDEARLKTCDYRGAVK